MASRKITTIVLLLMIFIAVSSSSQTLSGSGKSSIIIDGSIKYQEIEGFGGSGAYYESLIKNLREPQRTEVINLLFSDLGISIYRLRVWTRIEPTNDDNDPNNFNWKAFRFSTSDSQIWNAQRAKEKGVTKFIASVWSPPGWMKTTGREPGGGYLLPQYYEEFAEFLAAYIIGYRDRYGIDIGWISLQNEPDFVTDQWETCAYTPEQMRDLIKVVGTKFRAEELATKIIVPETAGCSKAYSYLSVIMADPEAARYVDVFAHHLYDIDFFNPDSKISDMKALSKLATKYNKPIWQTEYSYLGVEEAGTFKEAITVAHHIHNVLTIENASAYLHWALFWYRPTSLISIDSSRNTYTVNPVYYAFKQFSKFIAPGSRRIYAYSENSKVLVSAYLYEANKSVTIVIINRNENIVDLEVNLNNIPCNAFKLYRTSSYENCTYIGDMKISGSSLNIRVPAQSITTLFGYYDKAPSIITCISSKDSIKLGEALQISGRISPGVSTMVTIHHSVNGETWNTVVIQSSQDGSYSYTWIGETVGIHYFKASWPGNDYYKGASSSIIMVNVTETSLALLLQALKTRVTKYDNIEVRGSIIKTGNLASIKMTVIYLKPDGNEIRKECLTDSDGRFFDSVTADAVGVWMIRVMWLEDDSHEEIASETITVTVVKASSAIYLQVPKINVTRGEKIEVSGFLSKNGSLASIPITIIYTNPGGAEIVRNVSTDHEGRFYDSLVADLVGEWKVRASWLGDDSYEGSTSNTITLIVKEPPFPMMFITTLIIVVITIMALTVLSKRKSKPSKTRSSSPQQP
ncbi:MAG: hypothetical protein FGF52_05395 [Candidatus Brockarchaeota archaeon]|nr:hypothetical protein [Candidatus Brockarchaeota archaeon]